jgi:hypothetical protein
MRIALVALMAAALLVAPAAIAKESAEQTASDVETRLIRVEAQLEYEQEAHERQADAFDAAVSSIEFVAFALAVVLTLLGVVSGFVGLRWVRSSAEEKIEQQVKRAAHVGGDAIFQAEAEALRSEYDEKFADLYRRYGRLVEE